MPAGARMMMLACFAPFMIGASTYVLIKLVRAGDRWMSGDGK